MANVGNSFKIALRKKMKEEILQTTTVDSRKRQSNAITKTVLASEPYTNAKTISIYLSTSTEVDTTDLLIDMFKRGKEVFVPTYNKNVMEMVKLKDMNDYESLPLTKWKIKQPKITDCRSNALTSGGIDLFLTPGVAFSLQGGRMGHGMGFYDKYFQKHFDKFPRRPIIMGLAFKEQIVADIPLDEHDVKLDYVVTEDGLFISK